MGFLDDVGNFGSHYDPFGVENLVNGKPPNNQPPVGAGDTPGTPEADLRHPDWAADRGTAIDVFKQTFKNVAGRDPTAEEINGYTQKVINPALAEGLGGASTKRQYTDYANMANNYVGTNFDVDKLRRDKGTSDAPAQYGAVDQAFQTSVGRSATQEEKDHFGKLLSSGELDAYGLNDWLKQLPENVKKEDAAFTESLRTQTSANDARYFNEQIMPGIGKSFANQGRSFDSSAYANALGQAAQGQNVQREGFLTGLTADQYSGNKGNAYNAYLNSVGRYQQGQDYAQNRYDQRTDQATGRLYEMQNYNMQKQAYDQYLQKYGKRSNSGMGAGAGSLLGMGLGAAFAAPTGGLSLLGGAALGGAAGGAGGSMFDAYV